MRTLTESQLTEIREILARRLGLDPMACSIRRVSADKVSLRTPVGRYVGELVSHTRGGQVIVEGWEPRPSR